MMKQGTQRQPIGTERIAPTLMLAVDNSATTLPADAASRLSLLAKPTVAQRFRI